MLVRQGKGRDFFFLLFFFDTITKQSEVESPPVKAFSRERQLNMSIIAMRKNPIGRRAGAWRHLFAYTTAFSVFMYALFLWSMSTTSEPSIAQDSSGSSITQDSSAGNIRSGKLSSEPVHGISVHQLDIDMAEFAYENQKGERSEDKPLNSLFSRYGANWPCFWGETAVGDLKTWQDNWNTYKDGWKVRTTYFCNVVSTLQPNIVAYKTYKSKYVCGLSHITDPCIVYSLGSSGNMAFEKDVLSKGAVVMTQFVSNIKTASLITFCNVLSLL